MLQSPACSAGPKTHTGCASASDEISTCNGCLPRLAPMLEQPRPMRARPSRCSARRRPSCRRAARGPSPRLRCRETRCDPQPNPHRSLLALPRPESCNPKASLRRLSSHAAHPRAGAAVPLPRAGASASPAAHRCLTPKPRSEPSPTVRDRDTRENTRVVWIRNQREREGKEIRRKKKTKGM
jgi:hypothetical protein